jgi:prokaryotic ubiquitin-like protein Pup
MPERERKQKPAPKEREETVEEVAPAGERGQELKEDIDDLLDEIDSVLEENA